MSPKLSTAVTPTIVDVLPSWRRSLDAEHKSARTVQSYDEAAQQFVAFLTATGMPMAVASIRREHVESFLVDLRDRGRSASTVRNRFASLQQLFRWLEDEGEITVNPMAKMRPPAVAEQPVDVLSDDELTRLFAARSANTFDHRRDSAMLRVLLSNGARVGELTGLRVSDLDVDAKEAFVMGKGSRGRVLPLSPKTVKALDRYLRVRARHPHADLPWLWLGKRGPVKPSGVAQILRKLGDEAGVEHVHPHRFRHTFAHDWLASGGSEGDLMRLAGWRSRDMLGRYGASAADSRARAAHATYAPGESI
jgi:site-specific recombinase XerD